MLKIAGAGSIGARALARGAAAKPFKASARGGHGAAAHQPYRAGVERLYRGHELRTESGSRCSLLAQVGVININARTALGAAIGGGQAENHLLLILPTTPAGISASERVNILMPVAVIGQMEGMADVGAAAAPDQRDADLRGPARGIYRLGIESNLEGADHRMPRPRLGRGQAGGRAAAAVDVFILHGAGRHVVVRAYPTSRRATEVVIVLNRMTSAI